MISHDDIAYRYQQGDSLKRISCDTGICIATIRRVLITEGIPLRDCPHADHILSMLEDHHTPKEIAEALGIRIKTVMAYMPYTRDSYSVGEKSANAKRIAVCRKKKNERLAFANDDGNDENNGKGRKISHGQS